MVPQQERRQRETDQTKRVSGCREAGATLVGLKARIKAPDAHSVTVIYVSTEVPGQSRQSRKSSILSANPEVMGV
jgi:hypothetical protein